jgi:hypothetical protein
MKPSQRIALIVGVLVVAVVAFIVLSSSSGDDDEGSSDQAVDTTETQPQTPTTRTDGTQTTQTTATTPEPPPAPPVQTIEVRNGEPEGGVQDVEAKSGDRVEFRVTSDAPEEVHLHGYDIEKEVGPGKPATFEFDADLEGQFEIELHGTATLIGQLTVSP